MFQVLLYITNNSIKHQSFVYTKLNDQIDWFQTIQFTISHLFAHSLNVKQFYLTYRYGPIRCYHCVLEWILEQSQWGGTPHSPKVKHYWSLTIKLFCVISGHSLGKGFTTLQGCIQSQPNWMSTVKCDKKTLTIPSQLCLEFDLNMKEMVLL